MECGAAAQPLRSISPPKAAYRTHGAALHPVIPTGASRRFFFTFAPRERVGSRSGGTLALSQPNDQSMRFSISFRLCGLSYVLCPSVSTATKNPPGKGRFSPETIPLLLPLVRLPSTPSLRSSPRSIGRFSVFRAKVQSATIVTLRRNPMLLVAYLLVLATITLSLYSATSRPTPKPNAPVLSRPLRTTRAA